VVQNPRKRYEYEKARLLRRKGYAYNDIRRELGISKSTISLWCRDVELSKRHKEILLRRARKMILFKLGALANKENRAKEVEIIKNVARDEIKKVNEEAFKIAGAILYWAEGSKRCNTAISNSDPRIVKFMVAWWSKFFGIKPPNLKAYLHIHYGNDEKKIKKFWSDLTNIPLENFGKSFIKPKGTGHRTNILPNGVIRVGVKGKGVVNLRHRILAWIEKIYDLSINNIRP